MRLRKKRRPFVAQLLIGGGHSIEILPNIAIATNLVAGVEVALRQQLGKLGTGQQMPQTLQVDFDKTIGHCRKTTGKADEVMHIGSIAHVADDIGQIAQHQIVVVRLGVQKTRPGQGPSAALDLVHQPIAHHLRQRVGPLRAPLQ